ncbi:MAG: hypothetical protein V1773_00170, partial [bacterium]
MKVYIMQLLLIIFFLSQDIFPNVNVTSPNGGENWQVGSQHNITWTDDGLWFVTLKYSTDSGNNWITIASNIANQHSYGWTIPATASLSCKVKVEDAANSSVYDISNSNFTISGSAVTVTSPNGGENWQVGSQHNITWTDNGLWFVTLRYSTDSGNNWITIASNIANQHSYGWTIPATASLSCKVKVEDAANSSIYDISNSNFTISGSAVTVTSPNGGENWQVGSQH